MKCSDCKVFKAVELVNHKWLCDECYDWHFLVNYLA